MLDRIQNSSCRFGKFFLALWIGAYLVPAVSLFPQGVNIQHIARAGGYGYGIGGEGDLAYTGEGPWLTILDMSAGADRHRAISKLLLSDTVRDVEVKNSIAYVALGNGGMQVVDCAFPTAPQKLGWVDTPGFARRLHLVGSLLYVCDGTAGVQIIDVSNPSAPILRGSCDTPGDAQNLAVGGLVVYVADGPGGVVTIDVSNSSAPAILGTCPTVSEAADISFSYPIVYVAEGYAGMESIDVLNPANPFSRGLWDYTYAPIKALIADGLLVFAATDGPTLVLDVSDPLFVAILDQVTSPGEDKEIELRRVGDRIFGNSDSNGVFYYDISMLNQQFLVWGTSYSRFVGGYDLVRASDRLWVFASSSVQLLDIGGFHVPIQQSGVTFYSPQFHRIFFENPIAYLSVDLGGILSFDLSDSRFPQLYGGFDTIGRAWEMVARDNFAYVADGYSGVSIYDRSTPGAETLVGNLSLPGGAFGIALSGDTAIVAGGIYGLQTVNIANPASPSLVGSCDTPDFANQVKMLGSLACVADRASGLQVIDVSNPALPSIVGAYDTQSYPTDMEIFGNLVFMTEGSSGLDVVDLTNPANPVLGGYYLTPTSYNGLTLDGLVAFVSEDLLIPGDAGGIQVYKYTGPNQPPYNDASLVHYEVPPKMAAGYPVPISIRIKNEGNTAWTAAAGFDLAITTDTCGLAPVASLALDAGVTVNPNGEYTFTTTLNAPLTTGTCTIAFRMEQSGSGVFGQLVTLTPEIVDPLNDSQFVDSTVPAQMAPGEGRWVGFRFKNTGTTTWSFPSDHDLEVLNDPCGLFGGVTRIDVAAGEGVLPGETYEFEAFLIAPATPGACTIDLRMTEAAGPNFGQTFEATINVVPPANAAREWARYE